MKKRNMNTDYHFIHEDHKQCPVCLKFFLPLPDKITPVFQHFDGVLNCRVDMCYNCSDKVLLAIQSINPNIKAGRER